MRVGQQALLFKCFAGCHPQDVLRSLWHVDPVAASMRLADRARVRDGSWSRQKVITLWAEAWPIADTPAQAYLAARGIRTGSGALRFHPHAPLKIGQRLHFRPAMLAAVREHQQLVAVQRAFLDVARPGLARDLVNPRRLLGRPGHGAVRLAGHGPVLGLAEGIETALSAMQLLRIPVWATLGAERFAQIRIPAEVEQLILLPDNDPAGRAACDRAFVNYSAQIPIVIARMPPAPACDWNDALRLSSPALARERD
ncbi:toprim domain-containing protein [Sphingomonas sp. BIUV-7]|uniref:Toprim domain-containing protein n=1 Tax=Sphingomonas natans TaxID=3063330 RepID=A0ABT8YAL2_9SPHN|nr:toprim domain-containing protein [Sphingomonas sp. BIUV-7]MDO6415384.1 toprim domain-containing protein [Sphingomonas sp. BIUV-7]